MNPTRNSPQPSVKPGRIPTALNDLHSALENAFGVSVNLEIALAPVVMTIPTSPSAEESPCVKSPSSVADSIDAATRKVAKLATQLDDLRSRLEL